MAKVDSDVLPGLLQEVFRDRDGAKRLLEHLLEQAMAAEVSAHVAAGPHERTDARRGHRNGYKPRTLNTRVGELELQVPQVRACEPYHPSMFARWQRSERALLVACAEMYFQGVSTRNVRNVLEAMCDGDISSTTVSRVAQELDEKLMAFRHRRLDATEYPYMHIDARYEKVRVDGRVVSQAVLVAVGFTSEGRREILDWRVGDSESMACKWEGRYPAVAKMLREGLEDCLAVLDFPEHHRRKLKSTNMLENLMKRLKKRSRVVGVFPSRSSCDRLLGAQLVEVHEKWSVSEKAYFNMENADLNKVPVRIRAVA